MSDSYFIGNSSQTEKLLKLPDVKSVSVDNKPSWVPRAAIPWTKEISDSLLNFFVGIDYPFRHVWSIPFKDPLRSEIRRFLLSLDAYIESPNPVIPYRDILYGSTNKDYAKTLKRIKRKAFETTWNVEHFEFPDWWNNIPSYRIKDIGDIFNYSYLIFWKMEDPDDYLHGMVPVKIDPLALSKFKETLKGLLPDRDSFEKIDIREIISQISSSMSINRGETKHLPQYMIKHKHLYLAKDIGTVERVILQVSPENCRDSVLVDPAGINTISAIDQQLMEILRVMPEHIHLRDKDEVTRRMRRLCKYRYFLQRDLRKEGITKPRELLKAMLEVLHEEYPDIEQFGYTSFYDNFSIHKDGEIIYPMRGHGLGMANSLTTLMQIVIHNMNIDELSNDIPEIKAKALTLNDDFVVAFNDEYHVDQYWETEDRIMESLSLLRAPEKSFYSECRYVLAERYFNFDSEYEKISYQLRECLLPLACTNIVHAKEYFRSVQTYVNSTIALTYIDEIRNYWGYEFYPSEFNYPYIVGGWINERIDSIDLSLVELEDLEYNSNISKGFFASKVSAKRNRGGDNYISPFMIINAHPRIPEEYREYVDFIPISQIHDKYGRILSKSQNEFTHYWERLMKKRKNAFKKGSLLSFDDLINNILSYYSKTQFYPCKMMISHYAEVKIVQTNIKDIYIDPNPRMSMISKYNQMSYPFKEEFSINFSNPDSFTKKTSGLYSKEVERTLKNETVSVMFSGKFHEVYIPIGEKPEEIYLNPIKIGQVASKIDWGKGYPIIKNDYKHPMIEKKREVFNCLFSLDDQILLSNSGLNRICIKTIASHIINNPHESIKSILNYLIDVRDEYLESQIVDEVQQQDSDEEMDYVYPQIENPDPNKRLVSIESWCSDESLIWSMLSDSDSYQCADMLTQRVFDDLRSYYVVKNLQFGDDIIDLNDQRVRLLERYGPRVAFIVKRSGILNDTAFDIQGGSDLEDLGLDLWNE